MGAAALRRAAARLTAAQSRKSWDLTRPLHWYYVSAYILIRVPVDDVGCVVDEDRRELAETMDREFYGNGKEKESQVSLSPELQALVELSKSNPDLLTQFLQTVQTANK